MRKQMSMLVAATAALSVVFAGVAVAASEPTESIPAAKQAKLLDKFGDQGIDADGDGVLTHEEVKAFFGEKHHRGATGMHGPKGGEHHGMKGCCPGCPKDCCPGGMKGCCPGGMRLRMDYGEMTEEHIAKMLKRHPEADTDGDGLLSEAEFEACRAQRMEEHRAMVLEHHAEADTDGDGTLSEEEARVFMGDHPEGFGCEGCPGHGDCAGHKGKKRGGCAGHGDKGHSKRARDKDKGHGGCAHHEGKEPDAQAGDEDKGHAGCAHREGKGQGDHSGRKHKEHGGCTKGK